MSNINTGGPAFPFHIEFPNKPGIGVNYHEGMTMRDYFAAKAISELMRVYSFGNADTVNDYADAISKDAYAIADAMLKARGA